ncbi:MAG TPA: rRNA maturation RNase YbeY [Puia sp.]|nr:rRNA maturation RNase YbeY [Puia sp.]
MKKGFTLRNRMGLKQFLLYLFRKEGLKVDSINYVFTSDGYLRTLNRHHLHHDYNTDILTFIMSEPGDPLIADIFISIDSVRSNSIRFKSTLKTELFRVIFHGALHACGYNDKTATQKKEMRSQEDLLLDQYKSRST